MSELSAFDAPTPLDSQGEREVGKASSIVRREEGHARSKTQGSG
jgi:hypothetical protein